METMDKEVYEIKKDGDCMGFKKVESFKMVPAEEINFNM